MMGRLRAYLVVAKAGLLLARIAKTLNSKFLEEKTLLFSKEVLVKLNKEISSKPSDIRVTIILDPSLIELTRG